MARFRWDLGDLAWGIAATMPLLAGLHWCLRTRWGPLVRLVALVEEQLSPLFAGATRSDVVLLALAAGLAEEVLFRGVIQEALSGPLPTWVAVAAASVLFGLAHWVSATYALLAMLVGCYFGVAFHLSGNLLVPVLAHVLYDLVALHLLVRLKPPHPASVV